MSWLSTIWTCFSVFWQNLFFTDGATPTPTICCDQQRRPYVGTETTDNADTSLQQSRGQTTIPPQVGLSSLPRLSKSINAPSSRIARVPYMAGVALTPAQSALSGLWKLLKQVDAQYGLFCRYDRSQGHLNGVGIPTPERLGQFFLETGEGTPSIRYAVASNLLRYHPHAAITRQFWENLTLAGDALRP